MALFPEPAVVRAFAHQHLSRLLTKSDIQSSPGVGYQVFPEAYSARLEDAVASGSRTAEDKLRDVLVLCKLAEELISFEWPGAGHVVTVYRWSLRVYEASSGRTFMSSVNLHRASLEQPITDSVFLADCLYSEAEIRDVARKLYQQEHGRARLMIYRPIYNRLVKAVLKDELRKQPQLAGRLESQMHCQNSSCASLVNKLLFCARCKQKMYCSKSCQEQDWKQHKQTCVPLTSESDDGFIAQLDAVITRMSQ